MKYPPPFPTSARRQSRAAHENRRSPGGAARRSHLGATRLKQLTRVSPTWPRKHPSSLTHGGRPSLGCRWPPLALTALPECCSAPRMEGRTQSPICYCAHDLRWQVKWLTRPLGPLIHQGRAHGRPGWSRTLDERVQVWWGSKRQLGGWVMVVLQRWMMLGGLEE